MEQDNNGWYNTSDEREWYRQYSTPATETPSAPVKKKHTGMKVTMISLCVLALIAATAFAFHSDDESALPVGNVAPETDFSASADEFFENYFTSSSTETTVERAETGADVTLETVSCEGLKKLSLQQLYEQSIDCVVGITALDGGEQFYNWGTGIIMSADGYILTNAHLIEGTCSVTVNTNDGTEYEAKLVGMDTQSDIAVLKIDAQNLQAASFGISDELSVGDEVAAIGNPLAVDLSGTLTNGIVSAVNRDIPSNGHTRTLIQTNTAINEGNSGGPLFNMYGQVVGITNMKLSADYSQATIEGIGFAIPISVVQDVVNQLIATGKVYGRPGIGITVGAIPEEAASRYDLPDGLYINSVEKDSDAYAKGLRTGDVLTAVNGQAVYTTDDVNAAKDGYGVGESITLTIYRGGKTFDVEVELMDMNELYK